MEKSLVEVNEKGIFYRIKDFFINLFRKKEENIIVEEKVVTITEKNKKSLIEEISGKNGEELAILELQKRYKMGEIKEKDMTREQINTLCNLYDEQNEKLKKEIEYKEKKILEYRNSLKVS